MPQQNISFHNWSESKIFIEASEIRADPGIRYPRLIVNAWFEIQLQRSADGGLLPFYLSSLHSGLFFAEPYLRVSDLQAGFYPQLFTVPNPRWLYELEFPLDFSRIDAIERYRHADVEFIFKLEIGAGLYSANGLVKFEHSPLQIRVRIPQSQWVAAILPKLGYKDYFLIEIPHDGNVIAEAWKYVDQAERSFREWNIKGVFANCREVGALLDRKIAEEFGGGITYGERWKRSHAHLASLGLHEEDIKQSGKNTHDKPVVGRADAEHILLVTKALIKFAGDLLTEENRS